MLREKEFTSLFQKVTIDQITIRMILNSYLIQYFPFSKKLLFVKLELKNLIFSIRY